MYCHYHLLSLIIILKVMLISSLVVTYPFVALAQRGGGERQSILKQHLAPLQSYLHQRLVNSITALGVGELKEAKLSLG